MPRPTTSGEPRRAPSRNAGQAGVEQRDGIGALGLARGGQHGVRQQFGRQRLALGEPLVEVIADQVGQHLRVRLRKELIAVPEQPVTEGGVVFDDAIVDQRQFAGLVLMRMGIGVAGQPVRRPAGVADAQGTGDGFLLEQLLQAGDPAHAFAHLERAAVQRAEPR